LDREQTKEGAICGHSQTRGSIEGEASTYLSGLVKERVSFVKGVWSIQRRYEKVRNVVEQGELLESRQQLKFIKQEDGSLGVTQILLSSQSTETTGRIEKGNGSIASHGNRCCASPDPDLAACCHCASEGLERLCRVNTVTPQRKTPAPSRDRNGSEEDNELPSSTRVLEATRFRSQRRTLQNPHQIHHRLSCHHCERRVPNSMPLPYDRAICFCL
jgi:hypothetical protein